MNLNEPNYEIITYDLDVTEVGNETTVSRRRFNQLQYKLRRLRRERKKTTGFLEGIDYQVLELSYQGRRIRCRMKVDDYYFVGYQKVIPGSLLWEAYTTGETQFLRGSRSLGFSSKYGVSVSERKLGILPLRAAFDILWQDTPDDDRVRFPNTNLNIAFECIALNICEAARFQPVFEFVLGRIYDVDNKVPEWMDSLVKDWAKHSRVARMPQPTRFRIPEEVHEMDRDEYRRYVFDRILDPRLNDAAPHFARKLIRVFHIP